MAVYLLLMKTWVTPMVAYLPLTVLKMPLALLIVVQTTPETLLDSTTKGLTQADGTVLQMKDPDLTFLRDLIKAVPPTKTLVVSTLDSLHNN